MTDYLKDFSDQYLSILKNELKGINLTRILDSEEFYHKQILDSIVPIINSKVLSSLIENIPYIFDIGFGGGFPLVVLGKHFPLKNIIGFEARSKKVEAVKQINKLLDINNVQVFHNRVEEIHFDVNCLITFKAVGTIEEYLNKIFSTEEIYVLFYKGPNVEQFEKIDNFTNWQLISKEFFKINHIDGRNTLLYKKNSVPRGTKMKKDLVKVSNLI